MTVADTYYPNPMSKPSVQLCRYLLQGPAVPPVHAVLHPDHAPLHLALLLPRVLHTARGLRNIRI